MNNNRREAAQAVRHIMDKRIFLGRFIFEKSHYRSGWRKLTPKLKVALTAPKPHITVHWLGMVFQWDSPMSEKEVMNRVSWPHKVRYERYAKGKSEQIAIAYHWPRKSLKIECIEI